MRASTTPRACRRERACFTALPLRPTTFEEGGSARWDEIKEEMGDRSLRHYQKFIANLTSDNIIKRTVVTPLDHARNMPNSMVGGDVHGVAPYFYQTGGHRPTPDLAQYTVPGVERFYLVGPFLHPGGGVYGAGRATAMRMFEHFGMDFDKVAGASAPRRTRWNLRPRPWPKAMTPLFTARPTKISWSFAASSARATAWC
jgi:hypothetical protein